MKTIVTGSYAESSRILADMFECVMRTVEEPLLGLSTGSTPLGMYQCLTEDYSRGLIDFSHVHTINLDEYVGLPRSHSQSFGYYMDKHLFSKVNLLPENTLLIDGVGEPEAQCRRYNEFLSQSPMDILVLGIGNNGHIGFNEPDDAFCASTHVVELADDTICANARFFERIEDVPRHAITMGMAGITQAREVVLIATGMAKAKAIGALLADDKIDPRLPCSILKVCQNATILIDKDLADYIQ